MDKIEGCSREIVTPYGVTMRQDINRCGNCSLSGSIECEIWIGGMGFTPFENELYDSFGNLVMIKRTSKHYQSLDNQTELDTEFISKVCTTPGAETG